MSDNDDNITKLIIFTLGIVTIGLFAYLIYKEYRGYKLGSGSQQQMSLADDNLFNLERKIHNLEMDKMTRGNVRTLQPIQTKGQDVQTGQFVSNEIDGPIAPRKVVTMNSKQVQMPNIHGLSRGDQDKVRRMFFDMK